MGCVSSCFRVVDDDDEEEREGSELPSGFRYCICIRCLTEQFYTVLFQTGEVHVASPSAQGTNLPNSGSLIEDISIPDTYHSPPRPLPYDDPRCSNCQHEGLITRSSKTSSTADKRNGYQCEGQSKLYYSESSLKSHTEELCSDVEYIFSSSEDEDVCPTCLEEYACENPRITLQCSHHYHLSCIYEWMERSEACPVCGKVMVFNETK